MFEIEREGCALCIVRREGNRGRRDVCKITTQRTRARGVEGAARGMEQTGRGIDRELDCVLDDTLEKKWPAIR